jgi:hypothetical protein
MVRRVIANGSMLVLGLVTLFFKKNHDSLAQSRLTVVGILALHLLLPLDEPGDVDFNTVNDDVHPVYTARMPEHFSKFLVVLQREKYTQKIWASS